MYIGILPDKDAIGAAAPDLVFARKLFRLTFPETECPGRANRLNDPSLSFVAGAAADRGEHS
jgi:hypothetical protein